MTIQQNILIFNVFLEKYGEIKKELSVVKCINSVWEVNKIKIKYLFIIKYNILKFFHIAINYKSVFILDLNSIIPFHHNNKSISI